ncbi:MAG: heavy-metal-associated domain-containing protein [Nitrospirae bacterium]|nr:heavy-metal-associated domain-containing protein [Nitrospirota bacterium]
MLNMKISSILILASFLWIAAALPAAADPHPESTVIVQVDGLSCPFCAFGLEKKLSKLPGAQSVAIKVDQGVAELTFAPGSRIDEDRIREAVRAGGFTPREIRILKPEAESPPQAESPTGTRP